MSDALRYLDARPPYGSIPDPLALFATVATAEGRAVRVAVGEIAGSELVLRVERATNDVELPDRNEYLVYLDLRHANGEWERLHRSTLHQRRGIGMPPMVEKNE